MHKDLFTLFTETNGFKDIPAEWQPTRRQNRGKGLRGENSRLIMEGALGGGGRFEVHQYKHSQDAWMDVHRADGSLAERHTYNASAFAYAHTATRFGGNNEELHFTARARDGRPIEEIVYHAGASARTLHNYPDYKQLLFHEELLFSPKPEGAQTLEREYRNKAGTKIKADRRFNAEKKMVQEVLYHDDGATVRAVMDFVPGMKRYTSVRTFTPQGLKDSERLYDGEGHSTSYCEYHTEGQDNPANPNKKIEETFRAGKLASRLENREDGTPRTRTDFEEDGKTIKLAMNYDANGERPRIITKYRQGRAYKRVQMGPGEDDEPQAQRVILYTDKGGAYRSRTRHRWKETGDEYWSETEHDPASGLPQMTLHPTPTGLVRQSYDAQTGRLATNERYTEPELGERLEQRTSYYRAAPLTSHPERNTPLSVHRVEDFADDGTRSEATEYRPDSSIKYKEHGEDGKWVRRAYAPGTQEVDEQTPVLFESVRKKNGKLERSSLYALPDPGILALHKQYNNRGRPASVRIEHMDGREEELTWKQFMKRRKAERMPISREITVLATVTPDVKGTAEEEVHNNATILTLQGSPLALQMARSKIMQRIPDASCELNVGEQQWTQVHGELGHYIAEGAKGPPPEFLERVDVLKVSIPYQSLPGDAWPQTVRKTDHNAIDLLRERAVAEAVEALAQMHRHTGCDLRLQLEPYTMKHKETDGGRTQYFPYVHVSWPHADYLPAAQYHVISHMLSDHILGREMACSTLPDRDGLEVGATPTSFMPNVASRIARDTARRIASDLLPRRDHPAR